MLVDTEYTDSLCAGTIYATTNVTGNRFGCNRPTVKTPFIPYALPNSPVGSDAAAVNVSYSDGPIAPAMVPDGAPYVVNKVRPLSTHLAPISSLSTPYLPPI